MKQLFLVYGTLKQNRGNNHVIAHPTTKFLGEFQTSPDYTLYDGGFPVVERGGETSIHGELFEVNDPDKVDRVFGLEGCSSQEQGHPDNWYDFDYVQTPHGPAVMFVMDKGESRRTHIVESGKWR